MLFIVLIIAIIGVGVYLYTNEEARKKVFEFFNNNLSKFNSNTIKIVAVVLMIIGIVLICMGINSYHYAKTHVWGDPGSISDREHKAPYVDKGKNCCVAGGICTFAGVIVFFANGKTIVTNVEKKQVTNNKADDNVQKIQELKKLFDSGIITEEEFKKKKEELLKKI